MPLDVIEGMFSGDAIMDEVSLFRGSQEQPVPTILRYPYGNIGGLWDNKNPQDFVCRLLYSETGAQSLEARL